VLVLVVAAVLRLSVDLARRLAVVLVLRRCRRPLMPQQVPLTLQPHA
jgi:hypothetical protein